MEQILAFVLGAGVALLVWGVAVAFKTASKAKEIEKAISEQQDWILRNDELVNRRIDQEVDRVNRLHTDSIAFTDSRVDKLESKLLSVDKDGCKPAKKLIKG
jgi:demethoxyubiquinone hydroxylase (CLK1/Coq7/Cat5 family)